MLVTSITIVLALNAAAPVAKDTLTPEDFRIYCGWLTEKDKDETKGLSKDKQMAKVAKLAFDLPVGTSGALSIRAAAYGSAMMPPTSLSKQAEGCTTTTIRDGELNEVSLTMVQPPTPSSCQ